LVAAVGVSPTASFPDPTLDASALTIRLTNLIDYAYIDTMVKLGPVELPGKSGYPQTAFAVFSCLVKARSFYPPGAHGLPQTLKLPNEPKSPRLQRFPKALQSNTINIDVSVVSPAMRLNNEPKLLSKQAANFLQPSDQIRPNQTTFSNSDSVFPLPPTAGEFTRDRLPAFCRAHAPSRNPSFGRSALDWVWLSYRAQNPL
jgi:hypothetical protein